MGGARALSAVSKGSLAAYAPDAISLLRIPLAALFPFALTSHAFVWAPIGVLLAAGATDVLDGWVARHTHHVTNAGSAIDAVADKVFAFTVLAALLFTHRMPLVDAALLSVREWGEAPLVAWYLAKKHTEPPPANMLGKATTTLQFVTIASLLLGGPHLLFAIAAGIAGAASVFSYWRRVL